MLLASAISCDAMPVISTKPARPLLRRFMPYSGSSSGSIPTLSSIQESTALAPLVDRSMSSSPLLSPSSISSGIQSTCRALQSLLGVPPVARSATPKKSKIPLPPTSEPRQARGSPTQEDRIIYCPTPIRPSFPQRGEKKRSRDDYEGSDYTESMEVDCMPLMRHRYSYDSGYHGSSSSDGDVESAGAEIRRYSTPKRRKRMAGPENLPFGLDRQDFIDLEDDSAKFYTARSSMILPPQSNTFDSTASNDHCEEEEAEWSSNDDAELVTLVLEKLNLSRKDWDECARVLGAQGEGNSLGKRWKWLMSEGKIGLKPMGFNDRSRIEGRRQAKRQSRGDCRMIF